MNKYLLIIQSKGETKYPHIFGSFPGGSDGKESAGNVGDSGFNPWVGKIPWRRAWQPIPVFLPGKSHGQSSLVGYGPRSRKESDMTEATEHTHTFTPHNLKGILALSFYEERS